MFAASICHKVIRHFLPDVNGVLRLLCKTWRSFFVEILMLENNKVDKFYKH